LFIRATKHFKKIKIKNNPKLKVEKAIKNLNDKYAMENADLYIYIFKAVSLTNKNRRFGQCLVNTIIISHLKKKNQHQNIY
jgi:hypothetical protein